MKKPARLFLSTKALNAWLITLASVALLTFPGCGSDRSGGSGDGATDGTSANGTNLGGTSINSTTSSLSGVWEDEDTDGLYFDGAGAFWHIDFSSEGECLVWVQEDSIPGEGLQTMEAPLLMARCGTVVKADPYDETNDVWNATCLQKNSCKIGTASIVEGALVTTENDGDCCGNWVPSSITCTKGTLRYKDHNDGELKPLSSMPSGKNCL